MKRRARKRPIPPHSLELERALLGALLLEGERLEGIAPLLPPEAFYGPKNRKVYEALLGLRERGKPIDLLHAAEALGGEIPVEALLRMVEGVPTSAYADHYAKVLREKWLLRELIALMAEVQRKAYEEDLEGALALQERLFGLEEGWEPKGMQSLVNEALDSLENPKEGLRLGIPGLDDLLGGIHGGSLVLLAGRPGVGKTAFALWIALSVAKGGGKVGFFSLEMRAHELGLRLLAMEGGVDLHALRKGELGERELARLLEAKDRLEGLPIYIDDTPGLSLAELRARARALAREGLALLVVDYLGLLEAPGETRERQVAETSRGLKALARELGLPLLALSQLSRAIERREDKRPRLSDLRDSGALEQDADIVLFLWSPLAGQSPEGEEVKVFLAKNRQGPTGEVSLRVDRARGWFGDA